MYLTALRLVRPGTNVEGINAYHYTHGVNEWTSLPREPEENPGQLVNQHLSLPAGGNRVRSYLDLIAPDNAPSAEIRQSLLQFALDHEEQAMPWVGRAGRTRFRIGMEQALAQNWSQELAALWGAIQAVRLHP